MSSNNSEYKEFEREFALLRRPYVTLADAVKNIENECLSQPGLTEKQKVAPFDFTVYNIKPYKEKEDNLREIFRWCLGYDATKFRSILDSVATFKDTVDDIFLDKKKEKDELFQYYRKIIRAGCESNSRTDKKLEFIVAVYHRTYGAPIPVCWDSDNSHERKTGLFVPGLVHFVKHQKNTKLAKDTVIHYETKFDNKKDANFGLSKLIFDTCSEPLAQVSNKFVTFLKNQRRYEGFQNFVKCITLQRPLV